MIFSGMNKNSYQELNIREGCFIGERKRCVQRFLETFFTEGKYSLRIAALVDLAHAKRGNDRKRAKRAKLDRPGNPGADRSHAPRGNAALDALRLLLI